MTTAYISGPMRGKPNHNHDTFCEVAEAAEGYFDKVFNPALNLDGDNSLDYAIYMTVDLQQVLWSDAIVFLPGWGDSEGAVAEARVALATGKRFYEARDDGSGWAIEPFADVWVRNIVDVYEAKRLQVDEDEPAKIPATLVMRVKEPSDSGTVRAFDTGATRDTDSGKLDYEGFIAPAVLEAFAKYMHKHRVQSDGSLRDADNWQKGMPFDVYMKSMWRHFFDVWKAHRGLPIGEVTQLEALMALLFNVQGYAFELLRAADGCPEHPDEICHCADSYQGVAS